MAEVDGRTARGLRTRQVVAEAFLDLIDEGDPAPRFEVVAARAQVSLRTVYSQFRDLEGLRAEAGRLLEGRLADLLVEPLDLDAPFDDRLEAFVQRRATWLQAVAPFARSAASSQAISPELTRQRRQLVAFSQHQLAEVFAPELAALDAGARDRTVQLLHAVSGWSAWAALVDELELPVETAAARTVSLLRGVLA